MIINNNKVETKQLIKPNYDYLAMDEPFVTIGEINFETQISENSSIALEYQMFLSIKQFEGEKPWEFKEVITIR